MQHKCHLLRPPVTFDVTAAAADDGDDDDDNQRSGALAEVRDHSIRSGLGGTGHLAGTSETPPPSPADPAAVVVDPMAAAAANAAASHRIAERTVTYGTCQSSPDRK